MTYSLLTSPGGHGYLSGSASTMPALVEGLRAIALQNDQAASAIAEGVAEDVTDRIDYSADGITGAGGGDLNAVYGNGVTPGEATGRIGYAVYWLAGSVDQIANMPPTDSFENGTVEVFTSTNSRQFIQRLTFLATSEVWLRAMTYTSQNVWVRTPWTRQSPDPNTSGGSDGELMTRRTMLLDAYTARRGGSIGTGGLPAVALRFDHHLDSFAAKVLPLLRERGIPWTQAINPENVGSGDDNAAWGTIQSWCLNDGGEVFNHGGNHLDVSGTEAITAQIVGALDTLTANLPRLAIEGWAPPGLGSGGYDGYTPPATVGQHADTLAGRLVTGHHAIVSGYIPNGLYRPMDGTVRTGQQHVTIDQASTATVTGYLNGLPSGHGLVLMLHPNYLDQAGYMSTATLTAVLDDIAARRDAGELVVLSHTGLVGSDASHSRRDDLLSVHAAMGDLAESVALNRRGYLTGGMRELTAQVVLDAPVTVTTTLGESVKAHTLAAGTHTVRHVAVIPLDLLTVPVSVAGAASVADAHCLTI